MARQEIEKFIDNKGITFKWKAVSENPNMLDSGRMNNFSVLMECRGKTYHTYFSAGTGRKKPKDNASFLYCLMLDRSAVNGCSLDDFAEEFGYDKPSVAIRIYTACQETQKALERMFSASELEELEEALSDF